MLIIAIVFTISAAFRGWKGWAIIPLVLTFGGSFLTGMIIGSMSSSTTDAYNTANSLKGFFAMLEVSTIIVLIIMTAVGRKKKAVPANYSIPSAYSANFAQCDPQMINLPQANTIFPVITQPPTEIISQTVVYRGSRLIAPDGHDIMLTGATKSIGRSDFEKSISPNTLNLISRQHLLIKNMNGRYYVEDSNSANGTKVNGIDIKGKGHQELKDGDMIDLANVTTITYQK